MVVSFVAVGPVVAGHKVCAGRLGGFLEAEGSDLYADRRHQWFTVCPDDVITAEA
jgi:hypothetical protein